ncbi:MAG: hypothetical protein ACOCQ4_02255 [bacterium]
MIFLDILAVIDSGKKNNYDRIKNHSQDICGRYSRSYEQDLLQPPISLFFGIPAGKWPDRIPLYYEIRFWGTRLATNNLTNWEPDKKHYPEKLFWDVFLIF